MDAVAWVAGAAAIAAAATLLLGTAGMVTSNRRARPWLLVLFEINARHRGVSRETLSGLRPVDLALLLLAGAAFTGFWPGPRLPHPVWMTLAIAQPLLGIALLLATRRAGRSGLMGGVLVLSILMLVDGIWPVAGWLGATASLLLLVGDVGTTSRPSRALAASLMVGYCAMTAWFGWIGVLAFTQGGSGWS